MKKIDYYEKLRPFTEFESCECENITALVLVYLFTDNPINCFKCRKEIDPEKLKLTAKQVDSIHNCFSVYGSLYRLWIDSGEYEEWAKNKLQDQKSQVNIDGMLIVKELSEILPTYYWWFWDTDDGEPKNCPNCNASLNEDVHWGTGKCDKCKIII